MRDMLRNEGERVQREIAAYASLSQTANLRRFGVHAKSAQHMEAVL
jgi:hypothetical protein